MAFLILAGLGSLALGASEIVVQSSRPVAVFVDGRPASLTPTLKAKTRDLEPGRHQVRIASIFGKTIYEEEVELEDWTRHRFDWRGGTLAMAGTDLLPRPDGAVVVAREPAEPVAPPEVEAEPELVAQVPPPPEEPELTAESTPQVEGLPPEVEALPADETPALASVGAPLGEVDDQSLAPGLAAGTGIEVLAVPVAPAPEPEAAPVARPITVHATDGMRIEVRLAGSSVFLTVEGDEVMVEDGSGLRIGFGAPIPAPVVDPVAPEALEPVAEPAAPAQPLVSEESEESAEQDTAA
jgi:hypothetical protein